MDQKRIEALTAESIELLQSMIETPSVSRDEKAVADLLEQRLTMWGMSVNRKGNNVWIKELSCHEGKPVILLNSHIDTVKPAARYTKEPHKTTKKNSRQDQMASNNARGPRMMVPAT